MFRYRPQCRTCRSSRHTILSGRPSPLASARDTLLSDACHLRGLPGVGRTAIARELARTIGAVHLRIDSIEQALRRAGYRER